MTRSWHKPDRNSAVQQSATYQVCYLFDRKVAAAADPFADEVTLSRKRAKSRTPITGLRSKTTKARTRVDRLRAANADLKKKLSEALEQQAATSEVLRVISSSPTDLAPVFDTILTNATRLCEGNFALLCRYDGGVLVGEATCHGTPEFTEKFMGLRITPGREGPTRLAALERQTVHVADMTV